MSDDLDLTRYRWSLPPEDKTRRLRMDLDNLARYAEQVPPPREVVLGESAHRLLYQGLTTHAAEFAELGDGPIAVILATAGAVQIIRPVSEHPSTLTVRPLGGHQAAWATSCKWVGPTWLYRPTTGATVLAVIEGEPDARVARVLGEDGELVGEVPVKQLEADGVRFMVAQRPAAPELSRSGPISVQ